MKIQFGWNRKNKTSPFGISVEECLSKDEADKLRTQDFQRLAGMTSGERLKLFSGMFGDRKAELVNSRFENDVLFPAQQAALMSWLDEAKDVEPKYRAEIIREISALDRVLPEDKITEFMERLAQLRLGIGLTREETQMIFNLSKSANDAMERVESGGSRVEYDLAKNALDEYVASLMP